AKKRMADILARQRRRSNKFDVITSATHRIYLPAQAHAAGLSGRAKSALTSLEARVQKNEDQEFAQVAQG
ncbi:hypothetical protein ACC754_40420, partial [Rhizobium johnstonii]